MDKALIISMVLLVLKLFGFLQISWLIVFAPIMLMIAFCVMLALILLVLKKMEEK